MAKLVEIGSVVLEKKILNFVNVFLLFRNYHTFEKDGDLLWTHHPNLLCVTFG